MRRTRANLVTSSADPRLKKQQRVCRANPRWPLSLFSSLPNDCVHVSNCPRTCTIHDLAAPDNKHVHLCAAFFCSGPGPVVGYPRVSRPPTQQSIEIRLPRSHRRSAGSRHSNSAPFCARIQDHTSSASRVRGLVGSNPHAVDDRDRSRSEAMPWGQRERHASIRTAPSASAPASLTSHSSPHPQQEGPARAVNPLHSPTTMQLSLEALLVAAALAVAGAEEVRGY